VLSDVFSKDDGGDTFSLAGPNRVDLANASTRERATDEGYVQHACVALDEVLDIRARARYQPMILNPPPRLPDGVSQARHVVVSAYCTGAVQR
jgi:hypothetical protein